jgi:endonuclease/exonuclease/phosphatase family metal-dependent hydrolase
MIKPYYLILFAFTFLGASCDNGNDDTKTGNTFSECVVSFEQGENLEVATFNLEQFPKENNTVMHTANLIKHLNADIIALQEVTNEGALKQLADQLDGWEYVISPEPSQSLAPAYLIKMTEIALIEEATTVWFDETENDDYYFPRAPFVIKVIHRRSNQEFLLVNLHLKAMGDSESVGRRRGASNMLKDYIDAHYPDEFVIVLGDFNDELDEEKTIDEVFSNFTDDTENYRFADMSIATGNTEYWSYPGWPSHIDHILITDEWFEYLDTTMTVRPDACFDDYENYISDHRPVVVVFDL